MDLNQMSLATDAIDRTGTFDPRYTCEIDNSSPELRWDNPPSGVAHFAIIAEDADAGSEVFTHWLIYDIPSSVHHLPAGIPPQESLPNGIKQGLNSFGKLGYAGPCPPFGDRPHRYFFKLFALGEMDPLPTRLRKEDLLSRISPFIIATAHIMGRFQRMTQKAG